MRYSHWFFICLHLYQTKLWELFEQLVSCYVSGGEGTRVQYQNNLIIRLGWLIIMRLVGGTPSKIFIWYSLLCVLVYIVLHLAQVLANTCILMVGLLCAVSERCSLGLMSHTSILIYCYIRAQYSTVCSIFAQGKLFLLDLYTRISMMSSDTLLWDHIYHFFSYQKSWPHFSTNGKQLF